jgi:hypothetical protein
MGIPLRSNIFKTHTNEHQYFSRFPLQIAVLFSPTDHEFSSAFRDLFVHLDQITGHDIVFFALLDPPKSWLRVAASRPWWPAYSSVFGQYGFSYEDEILLNELARLFGVEWQQLPALVVSPNLWNGEHVVVPTSPALIEPQLQALTTLVQARGRPNIEQIMNTLHESLSLAAEHVRESADLQIRLGRFYGALDTYRTGRLVPEYDSDSTYWSIAGGDYRRASTVLRSRFSEINEDGEPDDVLAEARIADATGYLIPGAAVAAKSKLIRGHEGWPIPMQLLERESQIMISTAYLVGEYLGMLQQRWGRREIMPFDFTPGAQGMWKAFELEINYSLIQAARAARGIDMPKYFTLYDPNFLRVKATVQTDNSVTININKRDTRLPHVARHIFLTLGSAAQVIEMLLRSPEEKLAADLQSILGKVPPANFFKEWKRLVDLRNVGSHVQALSHCDYQLAMRLVMNSNHLQMLHTIKQALRS